MKRFLALVLLTVSLVSCSSCVKKNQQDPEVVPPPAPAVTPTNPPPPPPPVDTHVDVKGDSWQFTLPNKGWSSPDGAPQDMVVLLNPELQNGIIFETINGYPGTLDTLVLVNLRDMRNKGVTLVSTKQTELNGTKFVLVEATKNGNRVWMWIGVQNQVAYSFSCGGPESADNKQLCADIANTLRIH